MNLLNLNREDGAAVPKSTYQRKKPIIWLLGIFTLCSVYLTWSANLSIIESMFVVFSSDDTPPPVFVMYAISLAFEVIKAYLAHEFIKDLLDPPADVKESRLLEPVTMVLFVGSWCFSFAAHYNGAALRSYAFEKKLLEQENALLASIKAPPAPAPAPAAVSSKDWGLYLSTKAKIEASTKENDTYQKKLQDNERRAQNIKNTVAKKLELNKNAGDMASLYLCLFDLLTLTGVCSMEYFASLRTRNEGKKYNEDADDNTPDRVIKMRFCEARAKSDKGDSTAQNRMSYYENLLKQRGLDIPAKRKQLATT